MIKSTITYLDAINSCSFYITVKTYNGFKGGYLHISGFNFRDATIFTKDTDRDRNIGLAWITVIGLCILIALLLAIAGLGFVKFRHVIVGHFRSRRTPQGNTNQITRPCDNKCNLSNFVSKD